MFEKFYYCEEQAKYTIDRQTDMGEPAWKRLGLKVKAVTSSDPLALAVRAPESKKRKANAISNKDESTKDLKEYKGKEKKQKGSKPPKRVKLPKSERPIVIKDQLQYLRTYVNDKDNWKFSKQKQNWVIKNIRTIPEDYENDLIIYLKSVQGGSKDRIVNEMISVMKEWNKLVKDAEEQLARDQEKQNEEDNDNDSDSDSDNDEKTKKKQKKGILKNNKESTEIKEKQTKKPQPKEEIHTPPDYDFVIRARSIYTALTGESFELEGIEEEKEETDKIVPLDEVILTETTVNVDEE